MYQREDHGSGSAGHAGAIAHAPAFGRAASLPRERARQGLPKVDLVVNLGSRIGSPEWFRGLATLGALITATIWNAPGLTPPAISASSRQSLPYTHSLASVSAVPGAEAVSSPAAVVPDRPPVPAFVPPPIAEASPMRLTGFVGASLYGSERAAGVPPSIVADYIRAIAPRMDIGDIRPSDRYDMVIEHERAATGEVQFGRLLYASLIRDGQAIRLMRWTLGGREQWLDQTGAGVPHDRFVMPVTGATLSSGFGMRFHPILGFSRMHQGVDLAAPYGTPIVAASDGIVSFAGWHGGHGNFVQIVHDISMGEGYGHMSQYVVSPGESVQAGQLIGYVGSTGLATGPHCHFEVYRGGVPVDPATASFDSKQRLSGAALVRFEAAMARLAQ